MCSPLPLFTPDLVQDVLGIRRAGSALRPRARNPNFLSSINGLWLRQGDEQQQSVIHALRVAQQGEHLQDVVVFLYGPHDHFVGRIDADSAQLHDRYWVLNNAWVSGAAGTPVHHASYSLPTTLTPEQIVESSASPDTLSFWDLPGYIRAAQAAGFSATRYQLYLYTLYALPALFAAMVFMAASFFAQIRARSGHCQGHPVQRRSRIRRLFLSGPDQRSGQDRGGTDPAGGDGAGIGIDPDRHDFGLQPGGWLMKSSMVRLALGSAALLPLLVSAAAQIGAPAPAAKPEPTPILLQADEVVYDDDKKLVSALGHVEIADQGRTLLAERVEYDQATDKVTAFGHVSITDPRGNVAFADHVVLTDHMRDGVLNGFGALIGSSGRLAAQGAERVGGNTVIAHRAVYTPCKICTQARAHHLALVAGQGRTRGL